MKPQDVLFFIMLGILVFTKKPSLFVVAGLMSLIVSIPLFSFWVFFTASRLTWYAAAFFLCFLLWRFVFDQEVHKSI